MRKAHFEVGKTIGVYRVTRLIGSGGMGDVYEALDENLNRRVALKVISDRFLIDREAVERFKGEGRSLARLRHPNIVSVFSFFEHQDQFILVMEFVEGQSLDEYLRNHTLGIADIISLVTQIGEGLGAAHKSGVIHRDIKPSNIVVGSELSVRLIDFGIAKVHSDGESVQTSSETVIGTVNYFPPEILSGQMADPQSDIYSLGLVFYFLVTGQTPFSASSNLEVIHRIRTEALELGDGDESFLPVSLRRVFLKMAAKNPQNRYANLDALLNDLGQIDLRNLPERLQHSRHLQVKIENSEDALSLGRDAGFKDCELRLLLKLALDVEMDVTAGTTNEETIPLDLASSEAPADQVRVSRLAVDRAIVDLKLMLQLARTPSSSEYPPRGHANAHAVASYPMTVGKSIRRPQPLSAMSGRLVALSMMALLALGAALTKEFGPLLGNTMISSQARLPELEVGDWYRLKIRSSETEATRIEEWRLKEFQSAQQIWMRSDGVLRSTARNPFIRPLHNTDDSPYGKESYSGEDASMFPLGVGKKQEIMHFVESEKGLPLSFSEKCEVTGTALTQIEVGQFATFKVECSGGRRPAYKQIFFYSPELQQWILSHAEWRRPGSTDELVSLVFELVGSSRLNQLRQSRQVSESPEPRRPASPREP